MNLWLKIFWRENIIFGSFLVQSWTYYKQGKLEENSQATSHSCQFVFNWSHLQQLITVLFLIGFCSNFHWPVSFIWYASIKTASIKTNTIWGWTTPSNMTASADWIVNVSTVQVKYNVLSSCSDNKTCTIETRKVHEKDNINKIVKQKEINNC